MDCVTYLQQFNISDSVNDISCIHKLYLKLLNRFDPGYFDSISAYETFIEYESNMYDLVENLRELDTSYIYKVFETLSEYDHRLPDICILLWCVPRSNWMSKNKWYSEYAKLIDRWSSKILELIDNKYVQDFCIETITKTNYVPIHCLEYIWYYLNEFVCLEHVFINSASGMVIGFEYDHTDSNNKHDTIQCKFHINIEYIFMLGIGKSSIVPNKKSLQEYWLDFIYHIDKIDNIQEADTYANLVSQINSIVINWDKYMPNTKFTKPNLI